MEGSTLALDTIVSATGFFVGRWTPALRRNQSRDLLRFLLCKLYDQSRGRLIQAHITLAQGTLARKLGLSRQWVGILLQRLHEAGWLEYHAIVLPDGMRSSCHFRIGRQLKRLLITLHKARTRKRSRKLVAKSAWQFSPTQREKEMHFIQAKEKEPLSPSVLIKIPLLRRWIERGKMEESIPT